MTQQTIPVMYYIWDVLHGKASPLFTWNSGLGINLTGAFSLGGFYSPLNLFLYFTRRRAIPQFANILVVIKMFFMALSMYLYLKKYRKSRVANIMGSLLYAFGAATLVHYQIIMIMDAAFLFPLLMIGVDRIKNKNRVDLFICVLSLSLMVNIYTSIMSLIFVFLSHGTNYYLGKFSLSIREQRRKITLLLGIGVVIAVLISSVISLPAILSISKSPRMAGALIDTYKSAIHTNWTDYDITQLTRLVVNISLPLAVIIGYFFVLNKEGLNRIKQYKSQLIVLLFLFLSVTVPSIEVMWYGGSRMMWPVRFVFVATFALIDFALTIVEDTYEDKPSGARSDYWFSAVMAVLLVIGNFLFYKKLIDIEFTQLIADGLMCMAGLLVFFLIYFVIVVKRARAVPAILLAELLCCSMLAFYPNKEIISDWNPKVFDDLVVMDEALLNLETKPFQRIKNMDYQLNSFHYPIVLGREGVANFWHVVDESSFDTLHNMGYQLEYTQNVDIGGSVFTDALLGNSVMFSSRELPAAYYDLYSTATLEENLYIYESRYVMPLFMNLSAEAMTSNQLESDFFQFQNALFSDLTGSEDILFTDVSSDVSDGSLLLDIQGTKFVYFYCHNDVTNPVVINVNDIPVQVPNLASIDNTEYIVDVNPIPSQMHKTQLFADELGGIICLGCFSDETINIEVIDQEEGSISDSDIHIATMDMENYIQGLENAKNMAPVVESFSRSNRALTANLQGVSGGYIVIPVLYQEGWNATINGQSVEVRNYNGLVAIPVSSGDIQLRLSFVPSGLKAGVIITLVGALLACALFVTHRKVYGNRVLAVASDVTFALLFYIVLLVFFVIPLVFRVIPL